MSELLPKPVVATATPRHGWWPGYVLSARALWLLAAGLLFSIPAFFRPQLVWLMIAWDALILVLAVVDAALLPRPDCITVERNLPRLPALGHALEVRVSVCQCGAARLLLRVMDSLHPSWMPTPHFEAIGAFRSEDAVLTFVCWPRVRGPVDLGTIYLRYRSAVGLAERLAQADLTQRVLVLPSSVAAGEDSIFMLRARQAELERRRVRRIGLGREFENLREYQPGDERRFISWSATARRGKLITRTFTSERSQPVWIVVDAGRLSSTSFRLPVGNPGHANLGATHGDIEHGESAALDLTQLDQAASAALLLAQVADRAGDRSALLAYGRGIQQQIPPGKGGVHLRRILESLAMVRPEGTEADHRRAAVRLQQLQTRRAMIFWICEVAESIGMPEVAHAIADLARHHLCVLVMLEHPELREFARSDPRDAQQMFAVTAANEMLERRRMMLEQLRRYGVMVVETSPAEVGVAAINQYLEIKERGTQ